MNVTELSLLGCKLIDLPHSSDERGRFVKTYHQAELAKSGIDFKHKEEFYSWSERHVLRGMHFQTPPFAHQKLVHCAAGQALDLLVDLRKSSATFGQTCTVALSAAKPQLLYLPVGIAHGFLAVTAQTLMLYQTDSLYAPDHDQGIHWRSLPFELPVTEPVVSLRDQGFPALDQFESPFL
ncbi:dTDP-4-dehydrorhamnose 3,5-epimerase family protein [Rheinheimera sp. 1928-s]|uniref:dTDP-4-dehydrorhamnose 3,5-epimerase family protein n=1 Tax=Rheinheimera sp. 1928-s TaxID=3033803 RepID=UPI0026341649|nr:dTDP-4-dehydrorhamnose 3,5-epimerase family protein [Rheinheimera sp. 1928-s]MDF3125824.1 dTDP-4-dehydrorhamnose 3,5-epimerase family protein [Rheinheimera sp. 1928-s]